MPVPRLPGARIACALFLSLSALIPARGHAESILAWRDLQTTAALVDHLEGWLDSETDLPRRDDPPVICLIGQSQAANLSARRASQHGGRARGFYDADTRTIYLVRPWDARNPYDVSVLLHELIHHRQAEAGHWYCPGAQELPAYRLQDTWLGQMHLQANVNWIAVVLEAGCTRRDIHPD